MTLPFLASLLALGLPAQSPSTYAYPLASAKGLDVYGGEMEPTVYRGKPSVRLAHYDSSNPGAMAVLTGVDFKDGTVDFDIAGMPVEHARPDVRGFVGVAFHATDNRQRFECFYLRATNGRSSDQERRNHTVQYCCVPEYGWDRLRKEKPFRYEAYTDVEVGAWTHLHIAINGTEAQFYVGGSNQPCLVVHDLFLGPTHGKLALWVGDQSCAYFANLKVSTIG